MKLYTETGGHHGDIVQCRHTGRQGIVRFFWGGLTGYATQVHFDGEKDTQKVPTEDLLLVRKGPNWPATSRKR